NGTGSHPSVGVAARLSFEGGAITGVRVVVSGLDRTQRLAEIEGALIGRTLADLDVSAVSKDAAPLATYNASWCAISSAVGERLARGLVKEAARAVFAQIVSP